MCSCVCLFIFMCLRSEATLGARVPSSCELPGVVLRIEPRSSARTILVLNTDPSLHPYGSVFEMFSFCHE